MTTAATADVTIRQAERADDSSLAAIDRETWSPLVQPGPRPSDGVFFRPHVEPDDTLVAVVDGAIVGYVLLGSPTPLPASAHVQMIRGIAVAPAAQGRGVGRALVDAAVEEAMRRNAVKLTLRVLETNEGARRLYAAAGFESEGMLADEFLLEGRLVDDHLLARRLDA